MSNENHNHDDADLSPVDEVRRIRERLSAECGNDVRALAERVRGIGERVRREFGVKEAKVPRGSEDGAGKTARA